MGTPSTARSSPARPGRRADGWAAERLEQLLAMDPVLRQLADLVELDRDRPCSNPGHAGGERPRASPRMIPAICGLAQSRRPTTTARLGLRAARTHSACGSSSQAMKLGLADLLPTRHPVIAITVPGQEPEVIATQVTAHAQLARAQADQRTFTSSAVSTRRSAG
jgi:hypothetical protein